GGNTGLTPEKSRHWTAGLIFEPTNASSIGVDYWRVERRNSIGALGDTTVFDVFAAADPLNAGGRFVRTARLPGGGCVEDLPGSPTPANVPCPIDFVVQVQENLGKYEVSGIDVSATFRAPRQSWGLVTLRADGTYITRYKYQQTAGGPFVDNAGDVTSDNGAVPRWKHYATVNWRSGPFGATLAHNYTHGYIDDSGARRVASYETWDLQGTWQGWRGLGVTVGVRNVLDRDPPASDQGQTFQVGYDPRYTDARGRTFYAALKYEFK
ncbi:MAG TPA: TonB-dependent receptor, partial [Albitalea sp.]